MNEILAKHISPERRLEFFDIVDSFAMQALERRFTDSENYASGNLVPRTRR